MFIGTPSTAVTPFRGVLLKEGYLYFGANAAVEPTAASGLGSFVLYRYGGALKLWDGSSATTLGSAGGVVNFSLNDAYDDGSTITVDTNPVILAGVNMDTATLNLTADAASSGPVLLIANSGSGNDITGTGSTWAISAIGTITGTILVAGSGAAAGVIQSSGNYDVTLQTGNGTTSKLNITDGANGYITLTMNGTGKVEIKSTTEANDALKVTNGDVNIADGSLTIVDDDAAVSLSVTNDSATTLGAAAGTGVVLMAGNGLTTGVLLNLSVTEATLNGGFYLRAWDVTAAGAVFTVGEDGATVITGNAAGTDALTLTAGDIKVTAGKFSLTDNGATAASSFALAGSGAFTGTTTTSFAKITASGLTTGTALYVPLAAFTQGKGIHVTSGATMTTGSLLYVQDTGANSAITSGTLASFDLTSTAITGTVNKIGSEVSIASSRTTTTGTVADDWDCLSVIQTDIINGAGSMSVTGSLLYLQRVVTNTSGTITDTTKGIELVMSSLGTGAGISITHAAVAAISIDIVGTATTTGKSIDISDLNALTSGIGIHLASSATAITTTGRLFYSNHTGATGTSATLNEFATAATDETILLTLTASGALALGKILNISGAAVTTGSGVVMGDLNALTTGIGLSIASSATAITGAGRLVYVNHTGATGTTAILSEFASAANDETVILKVTASAALALGKAFVISAAALTTGNALDVSDLNALTTGMGLYIASSATAITGTGRMFYSKHTGATGTSATLNEFTTAATDETICLTVGASAALAAGKVLFVSGAAVTTGILLDISDNTAHTTGTALNVVTNSADTGTRSLVYIKQDHASASGATPLTILNDNATKPLVAGTATATSTNFFKFATINGVTIWMGNGNTANAALAATTGDILINGGSNKPEYCTNGAGSLWTALV